MSKLERDDWIDLARKLDWDYSYVREEDVFPEILSGLPGFPTLRGSTGTSPIARAMKITWTPSPTKTLSSMVYGRLLAASRTSRNWIGRG